MECQFVAGTGECIDPSVFTLIFGSHSDLFILFGWRPRVKTKAIHIDTLLLELLRLKLKGTLQEFRSSVNNYVDIRFPYRLFCGSSMPLAHVDMYTT